KSYKEGLGILEYFISTHGARKGTADTALRTASAGYLTRKLVDVVQDVIVKEVDCKDTKGIVLAKAESKALGQDYSSRIFGRVLLEDAVDARGTVLAASGTLLTKKLSDLVDEKDVVSVKARSALACKTEDGICQQCYGYDLGTNELVRMGSPVGVVAAQAIGEPGTQLTMRTFHIGGVAGGGDITQGLPRVEEIFEARTPKSKAFVSEVGGKVVDIIRAGDTRTIVIAADADSPVLEKKTRKKKTKKDEAGGGASDVQKEMDNMREYVVPGFVPVWVAKGDAVKKVMQLTEGNIDLGELLKATSSRDVARYIVSEVQKIYIGEGASISDKHIEVIVRKMFSRVRVKDAGDTVLITGDIIEKASLSRTNRVLEGDKEKATAAQVLLGITRIALTTESFLSAASFQETTRVLINASIQGKEDRLRGLKENVIIGKLIPAGTGYKEGQRQ
ncbi:DNA-directed RNA polymerase subunit beta', partial [Candidatus Azambacteria bacterium]|nr:DNA-directed RNA polymerase subunit beta' [Candidatus Azambacteria bacterium]